MSRLRVFIACSLDGFIAGPNDELDWLSDGPGGEEDTFKPFMLQVGALLMGRRTYNVVRGFSGPWFYGDTPVLVATRSALDPHLPTVRVISGDIHQLVAQAKAVAGTRDVYIDGGALIRSAMDAGLIDEYIVTLIPTVLGRGLPLFAGVKERHKLALVQSRPIGGDMVQLTYVPRSALTTAAKP